MFITKKNKNCFRRQAKSQSEIPVSAKTVEMIEIVEPVIIEKQKTAEETKKKATRVKKEIPVETVVTDINNEGKETE